MNNWEILKANSDYEINTSYPYFIRKIGKHNQVVEYRELNGYIRLNLHGKKYYKHRLIATQWIPNDDPKHKTQVKTKVDIYIHLNILMNYQMVL